MPVTILQKLTYIAMIRDAQGARVFQHLFAEVDGETVELLGDGKRACAKFVSSVAYLFNLVAAPHATVEGVERDLCQSGWRKTEERVVGGIIFWEPALQGGHVNRHVGFCVSERAAVSNDWETRMPHMHHITYGTKPDGSPVRRITALYTHPFLD